MLPHRKPQGKGMRTVCDAARVNIAEIDNACVVHTVAKLTALDWQVTSYGPSPVPIVSISYSASSVRLSQEGKHKQQVQNSILEPPG